MSLLRPVLSPNERKLRTMEAFIEQQDLNELLFSRACVMLLAGLGYAGYLEAWLVVVGLSLLLVLAGLMYTGLRAYSEVRELFRGMIFHLQQAKEHTLYQVVLDDVYGKFLSWQAKIGASDVDNYRIES